MGQRLVRVAAIDQVDSPAPRCGGIGDALQDPPPVIVCAGLDDLESPLLRCEGIGDVLQDPPSVIVCYGVLGMRRVPAVDSAGPDGDRGRSENFGVDKAAAPALAVADARSTQDLDADSVVALDHVGARRGELRHPTEAIGPGASGD